MASESHRSAGDVARLVYDEFGFSAHRVAILNHTDRYALLATAKWYTVIDLDTGLTASRHDTLDEARAALEAAQ